MDEPLVRLNWSVRDRRGAIRASVVGHTQGDSHSETPNKVRNKTKNIVTAKHKATVDVRHRKDSWERLKVQSRDNYIASLHKLTKV